MYLRPNYAPSALYKPVQDPGSHNIGDYSANFCFATPKFYYVSVLHQEIEIA
jgi:hypothetical protein